MKKTIGIIGGASWESTALYYQRINQAVREQLGGLNSAQLIINSVNYAPIVQLEREDNWDAVAEILINAAKSLEKAGADFVLLACNTLHKVAPAIEQSISIPFLHIADSAGKKFQQKGMKKIGLLGTQFTMEEDFYRNRLSQHNLQVIVPDNKECTAIDKIIYDELCMGIVNPSSKKFFKQSMQSMIQSGAEGILLGCTELGIIIKHEDASVPVLDTMVLHVETAVSLLMQ